MRSAVVVLSLFPAVFTPNFGYFISLIGALGCSSLAYILPAAFHLRILAPQKPTWVFVKDIVIVGFGLAATVICTSTTVSRILSGGDVGDH